MFHSKLEVRFDAEDQYTLLSPLVFQSKKYTITVLDGFKWNGANIPKLLQGFTECPMSYQMAYASCLHDALYASKLLNRKDCDKIFYEALAALGMDKAEAYTYYLGVRAGGESFYEGFIGISDARKFVIINV